MIIKNSIRQLWRMKGRTFLFLLLLLLASGLCSMGYGFWVINSRNTAQYEDSFVTIGTVEQKADAVEEVTMWDAEKKNYQLFQRNVYDSYVPESALDFEGAEYLSGPEKRVYYAAYNPDYETYENISLSPIMEVTPLEDVVPDHPVKLQIVRILRGEGYMEGTTITYCDHYHPEPEMLYQGRTYIISLVYGVAHASEQESLNGTEYELRSNDSLGTSQRTKDGKVMESFDNGNSYCAEVTEGFYESETGRQWLNLVESGEYSRHLFPVTATNDIHLMMPFYKMDVYINDGREFTEEEYEEGKKVCLIPEIFAHRNGLKVGDSLRLPLLYADYNRSAGTRFEIYGPGSLPLLNAEGEIYQFFEDSEYEIIGIYKGVTGQGDEYDMGYNEVVIPARSVKADDAGNIADYGPMRGSTTSFQIENGTIEAYMEKWEQQGIKDVEITFYDRGYSKLQSGIENMKSMARILVMIGAVMVLLVLGYFTWLFILKQEERTAVERCLGFKKRHCFLSLFVGIFLIILVGSAGGSFAGSFLSARVSGQTEDRGYFDKTFGNAAAVEMEDMPLEEEEAFYPLQAAVMTEIAVLAVGSLIAVIGIGCSLRKEPMEMLTR